MKCMFIGISGSGNEQMIEGFNIDIEFPTDSIKLEENLFKSVENLNKPQLFIQKFNKEYYLDLINKNELFEIIKNSSSQEFFNDYLLNKLKEKEEVKKPKI